MCPTNSNPQPKKNKLKKKHVLLFCFVQDKKAGWWWQKKRWSSWSVIISIQSESRIMQPLAEFLSSGPMDREWTRQGSPQGARHAGFQRGYWTVPSPWLWATGDRGRGVWWCTEAWVWHLGCLSQPQTQTMWHLTGWELRLQQPKSGPSWQ